MPPKSSSLPASVGYAGIGTSLRVVAHAVITPLGLISAFDVTMAADEYRKCFPKPSTSARPPVMLKWKKDTLTMRGTEEAIKEGRGIEVRECEFVDPVIQTNLQALHGRYNTTDEFMVYVPLRKDMTREQLLAFTGEFRATECFVINKTCKSTSCV
jgi:hypothetical protein